MINLNLILMTISQQYPVVCEKFHSKKNLKFYMQIKATGNISKIYQNKKKSYRDDETI